MPKNILKSLSPSPQKLRKYRSFRLLGDWIYQPYLWHINRLSASRAFAIGLFCAMMPAPGQMFVAAYFAVRWRANLPLSVSLIFVTNPLTMPVVYYTAYRIGAILMGQDLQAVEFEISIRWISESLIAIWQPFLLGCFVQGFACAAMGYFVIDVLWRMRIVRHWEARRRARLSPR